MSRPLMFCSGKPRRAMVKGGLAVRRLTARLNARHAAGRRLTPNQANLVDTDTGPLVEDRYVDRAEPSRSTSLYHEIVRRRPA